MPWKCCLIGIDLPGRHIMEGYKEVFNRYLATQGLKMTRTREAILDAVFATHSHFDVEDLHYMLRDERKDVSIATIYRTIPYLLQAGLIRRSMCDEQKEKYEHIYGHPNHLHIHCIACDRLVEQSDPALERSLEEIADNNGFTIRDYMVSIKGLCSLCRNDNKIKE